MILSYRGLGLAALTSIALAGCAGASAENDKVVHKDEAKQIKVLKSVDVDGAGGKVIVMKIDSSDGPSPMVFTSGGDVKELEAEEILAQLKAQGIELDNELEGLKIDIEIEKALELAELGKLEKLKIHEMKAGEWTSDNGDVHIIKKHVTSDADGKHVIITKKSDVGKTGDKNLREKLVTAGKDGKQLVIIKKHKAPKDGESGEVKIEKEVIIINGDDAELDEETLKLLEDLEVNLMLEVESKN